MDDQILIIDDEDLPQSAPRPAGWKVMIVDDEPEVHRITKITLNKFEFDGKPIDFLHAYSAAEAKALLALTPDVALLLLDVVMEVETIRRCLILQLIDGFSQLHNFICR